MSADHKSDSVLVIEVGKTEEAGLEMMRCKLRAFFWPVVRGQKTPQHNNLNIGNMRS